jgi:hypothetical protein
MRDNPFCSGGVIERLEDLRHVGEIFNRMQGEYIRHLDASASIETIHREILHQVQDLFSP